MTYLALQRHHYVPQVGIDEWRDTGVRLTPEQALPGSHRYTERHSIDAAWVRTVPADPGETVVNTICGL